MRMKGPLLRVMRRVAAVTLTLTAAVGITVAGALPALADTQQDYVAVSAVGDISSSSTCDVLLLSAQVASGGPAYVSAFIENAGSKTCTGWIERSANKGKTWSTVSKRIAVPHYKPAAYAKTADYYAGGDLARPCYQYGTGKASCGPAVTLRTSKAKDTGGSLPVSYARQPATSSSSNAQCEAGLGSTTTTKKPASAVDAFVINVASALTKAGPACTAVLQESANRGKSWKTVSASHVVPAPADAIAFGFTATYADGTGHLARVCVALASSPKALRCSKSW
jgi:hypothetical protein